MRSRILPLALVMLLASSASAQTYNPTASDFLGNVAGGSGALPQHMGNNNTAFGKNAMGGVVMDASVGIGVGALQGPPGAYGGTGNVAVGMGAARLKAQGSYNVMIGYDAGRNNRVGADNTFVGAKAGLKSTGLRNIAIGANAGSLLNGGTDNVYISHKGVATDSKTIRIGESGSQTRVFVAGIGNVPVSGVPVVINPTTGQLGVSTAGAIASSYSETLLIQMQSEIERLSAELADLKARVGQ